MWDVIGQAADILDLPRSFAYSQGNKMARAMGYTGPEIKNFSDVLQHGMGMDPNSQSMSVLSMIGDAATDPLTYLTGLPLASAARSSIRRMAAHSLANPGKANPLFVSRNTRGLMNPLQETTFIEDAAATLRPMATLGDEANLSTPQMQRIVVPGDVPDHYVLVEGVPRAPRASMGNIPPYDLLDFTDTVVYNQPQRLLPDSPYRSYFEPGSNTIFVRRAASPTEASVARREAMINAIIENSVRNQQAINDLPSLWLRMPARLMSTAGPFGTDMMTAGEIMRDLAATTLSRRSSWGRLGAGLDFLFNPETNRFYYSQYRSNPDLWRPYVELYGQMPNLLTAASHIPAGALSHLRHRGFGTQQSLEERLQNINEWHPLMDQIFGGQ